MFHYEPANGIAHSYPSINVPLYQTGQTHTMNIDFEAELPDVTVQWLTNDGTVASLPIPIQENKQLQIKVSDARGDVTLEVQVTSDETCYVHSLRRPWPSPPTSGADATKQCDPIP